MCGALICPSLEVKNDNRSDIGECLALSIEIKSSVAYVLGRLDCHRIVVQNGVGGGLGFEVCVRTNAQPLWVKPGMGGLVSAV